MEQARINHFQQLRSDYGAGWDRNDSRGDGMVATQYPSVKQIFTDDLWLKNVKNLASIHAHVLPAVFKTEERKGLKTKSDQDKYANGEICTICTNKSMAAPRRIGDWIR